MRNQLRICTPALFKASVIALLAAGLLSFCGCQKNGASPEAQDFSVQGVVEVDGFDNPTPPLIKLYAAPQDQQLLAVLTDYPNLGFSPITLMMFNPLLQAPLASTAPNSDGTFRFDGVIQGDYILDVELSGGACPQPRLISVPANSNAGTLRVVALQNVNGEIADAVWPAGSSYRLTGDLVVLPSATLTIESGVTLVAAGDYSLKVTGRIMISGTPSDPVHFRLEEDQFQSGGDWGGLRLEQPVGLCQVSGLTIQGASAALRVIGGQAEMSESLFDHANSFAAYFSAGAGGGISHSICLEGSQGFVADNSSPQFDYNLIMGTTGAGLTAKTNSQATLHANVVLDCQTGLWSDWNSAPIVELNLFSGGLRGIDAQDGFAGLVDHNEFREQTQECIYLHVRNCYPALQYNNFVAAPLTILHVNGNAGLQADTVFAPYNYWDGEDAAGIPDRIIDGHDIGSPDNPIGPVDYLPFSSGLISDAGP